MSFQELRDSEAATGRGLITSESFLPSPVHCIGYLEVWENMGTALLVAGDCRAQLLVAWGQAAAEGLPESR